MPANQPGFPIITLTTEECELARRVAAERDAKDEEAGVADRLATSDDPVDNMYQAVCAEFAVCKHFGLPFNTTTDLEDIGKPDLTLPDPDNGTVDVKRMKPEKSRFSIRADTAWRPDLYIVGQGVAPTFTLLGFITYTRAHNPLWYREGIRPNAPPFYSVPVSALTRLLVR